MFSHPLHSSSPREKKSDMLFYVYFLIPTTENRLLRAGDGRFHAPPGPEPGLTERELPTRS